MTQYERMEQFLLAADLNGTSSFVHADVVKILGISSSQATRCLRAYQGAQANPNRDVPYVIHREGRTARSTWHIGHTSRHLRGMMSQFADDMEYRLVSVLSPTLEQITRHNPKAQPQATKTVLRIGRLIQNLEELAK